MLQVSQLFIYPIKSLGGISVTSAQVTDRGFQYDRRWMLVDVNNEFITQRDFPKMALLQVQIKEDGLHVQHKKNSNQIVVPFHSSGETFSVQVWSDVCKGREVDSLVSEWFSDVLSIKCKLVQMPDSTRRRVDTRYASNKEITSFADGFPFLLIGQASLDNLNGRLQKSLPMNRFRPSIVVDGSLPFEEDGWARFSINNIDFFGVKLCARCVITTINQDDATNGKEPLHTLSTYRKFQNKIYFGQNLLHNGEGTLNIGDEVLIKQKKKAMLSPFL